ncbi:putative sugar O-methyltransferase [Pelagibacterales bacterium SAG-MED11]|nr:putative sugar O-methyltransferase [Pelagibacterales bacterium SAG-MED11]
MIKKIIVYINAYVAGVFKLLFKEKNFVEIIIKDPKKIEPSHSEKVFYERLFIFYRNMKIKEINNPEIIKPSSLWQNHINNDYKFLIDSFKENNLENFSFFLNNFGNWNNYLGIEHNTLLKRYSKNFILKSYLKNEIFLKHYKIWKDFGYEKKDLNKISTPEFGNQLGAYIDGNFVTIGSFFNQIISKILLEHIKHKSKPIICDLGGGYGKLGYFLIKNFEDSCFIDFDIPEVLVLAAYYLMSSFPNKKTLLFGEKEFEKKDSENFDLIFMPSAEITKMSENSVDLFVNKNSLGEMRSDTAKFYIEKINYCSKIFFHMNHNRIRNVFDNKDKSLISSEYPIDMKKFDLVFDYPDLSHFIYTGRYDSNNDIFMKLFKITQKTN